MLKFILVCLALLPSLAQAQGRLMLEAGLVGGTGAACPGQYVGVMGRVAGPFSLYGMVENYRCADFFGSANRIGGSVRLGRMHWLVRPALRWGIEHDGGNISQTAGASLTLGRRYGARLIVHAGDFLDGNGLVLFQMGGYLSF